MASPAVTLTFTLVDSSNVPQQGKVVLTLAGYNGSIPNITGTATEAQQTITSLANAAGQGSVTFFGNYQMSQTSSYYSVAVYKTQTQTAPDSIGDYRFSTAGTFDLSAINPLNSSSGSVPFTYANAVITNPSAEQTIATYPLNVPGGFLAGATLNSGYVLRSNGTVFTPAQLNVSDLVNGSNVVTVITNDTNVTGSISNQDLTLGWTGTLASGRLNSNVVQAVTNDTNVTGSISAQDLTLGWTGTLSVARGGTGTSSPGLVAGTDITISGTWPNQTINASGVGSAAFSGISSGTNTTAAMVVGSGASLGTSGSGTIAATTATTASSVTGLFVASGKTLTVSNSITLDATDTYTYTFPSGSDTVVTLSASQTLTNKTLTLPTLNSATLNSPTLTSAALGTPGSGTLTNCTFPTLNQNTSGSAASLSIAGQTGLLTVTGLTSTNRIKTVRDAADTLLELGGNYTPTGTWTSLTMVTPVLGTPTSGTLTNCTIPFSGIASGTNSAATMTVGTGATLSVSGSGVITATGLTGTPSITVNTITSSTIFGSNLSGTFTGSPTFSQNPTFSGQATFSVECVVSGDLFVSGSLVDGSLLSGNSGQILSSTGTGVKWINASGGGSGTVNSGTANHIAYYSSTGTTVSSDSSLQDDGKFLIYTEDGIQLAQVGVYGWSASAGSPPSSPPDRLETGLSTTGAGIVNIGNGNPGDASGTINYANSTVTGTVTIAPGGILTFSGSGSPPAEGEINANFIYGVQIRGTAPSSGQVLTANSSNTASWQTPSSGGSSAFNAITSGTNSSAAMVLASTATLTAGAGTLKDKGNIVFDVTAFGATGNGSTDDTTSIQNAINAAQTAGGGVVWLPPTANFYKISAPLLLYSGSSPNIVAYSNITILGGGQNQGTSGTGTTIKQVTTGDDIFQGLNDAHNGAQSVGITFNNFCMEWGTGTLTNSGNGIYLKAEEANSPAYQGFLFQNLSGVNLQGSGKFFINCESLIESTFINCEANSCAGSFYLNGAANSSASSSVSTSVTFIGCYANMATNAVVGYKLVDCTYTTFSGCAADIGANITGSSYSILGCEGITFNGCGSEGDGTHTITNMWNIAEDPSTAGCQGIVLNGCFAYESKTAVEVNVANTSTVSITGFVSDSSVSGSTGLKSDGTGNVITEDNNNWNSSGVATPRNIASGDNWQGGPTSAGLYNITNGSSTSAGFPCLTITNANSFAYTAAGFLSIANVNGTDTAPLIKLSQTGSGADILGTAFTLTKAGIFSQYAGLTTAALGSPVPIFSQNSSLGFAVFNTGSAVTMETGTAGVYRISYSLVISTTFVGNTSVTLAFGWTDNSGSRTVTLTAGSPTLTAGTAIPTFSSTAATANSFTFAATSASITYTPAKTGSSATAGAAWVAVYLERLA